MAVGLPCGAISRIVRAIEPMTAYLFSCEHATCAVPEAHRELFRDSEDIVGSAEGWEPGSLALAQSLAMKHRTPLVHADVTRLLIDLSQDGDERWSRFSSQLPESTRGKLIDRHEKPYRLLLRQRISEDLRRHPAVLHVMVHTDAKFEGRVVLETARGADLAEGIAAAWRHKLNVNELDVRHFRNSDNSPLAASLAAEFGTERYAQIRLTVSQSFFLEGKPWRWETLRKLLVDSLGPAVEESVTVSVPESPSIAGDS